MVAPVQFGGAYLQVQEASVTKPRWDLGVVQVGEIQVSEYQPRSLSICSNESKGLVLANSLPIPKPDELVIDVTELSGATKRYSAEVRNLHLVSEAVDSILKEPGEVPPRDMDPVVYHLAQDGVSSLSLVHNIQFQDVFSPYKTLLVGAWNQAKQQLEQLYWKPEMANPQSDRYAFNITPNPESGFLAEYRFMQKQDISVEDKLV